MPHAVDAIPPKSAAADANTCRRSRHAFLATANEAKAPEAADTYCAQCIMHVGNNILGIAQAEHV